MTTDRNIMTVCSNKACGLDLPWRWHRNSTTAAWPPGSVLFLLCLLTTSIQKKFFVLHIIESEVQRSTTWDCTALPTKKKTTNYSLKLQTHNTTHENSGRINIVCNKRCFFFFKRQQNDELLPGCYCNAH